MLRSDVLTQGQALPRAGRAAVVLPALFAALLGLVVLWGVGFSHLDIAHNAAHDARHSNAFPCH